MARRNGEGDEHVLFYMEGLRCIRFSFEERMIEYGR